MNPQLQAAMEAVADSEIKHKRVFAAIGHYGFVIGGICSFWHPFWLVWLEVMPGDGAPFLLCGGGVGGTREYLSESAALDAMKHLKRLHEEA